MIASKGNQKSLMTLALVSIIVLLGSGSALASQRFALDNGLNIVLHTSDEISADPQLAGIALTAADRPYFPFNEQVVMAALEAMQGFQTSLDVNVYILPTPAAQVASSYASRSAIYLAPGLGEVAPSTVAYITTHEMGHVFTWAFLDGDTARWNSYLKLRGLDEVSNGPTAAHADRAREILAEDFRYLFGGALATESDSIENHDLTLPIHVFGLEEMLVEFVAGRAPVASLVHSAAFPNPCNPRTTVSMTLTAGAGIDASQAELRIFDIRGALVKSISGGRLNSDQVQIQWDGDNDSGSTVASGRYLYLMQVGSLQASGSLTLVR